MRSYPRRWGSEYYPSTGEFVVNNFGKEIYARDKRGNQIYPNRNQNIFARDATGDYYYAKDFLNNEYYPVKNNRSLFITDPINMNIRLALYADGSQRYPTDSRGNEYYLRENGQPILMRRKNGDYYLAKNKNGHMLVPWNYMKEYIGNEPCVYSKDAAGNSIYVKESAVPPALKALVRCICYISIICPRIAGCNTNFY